MSAIPQPPIAVSVLRDAVRRAVAASSTHKVAAAVGVSQGTVRKFQAGSTPHGSTLQKLTRWYVKESVALHLDSETAAAALDVLVSVYPEKQRTKVRAQLLDVLREAHRAAGTEPPKWLK